MCVDAMRSTACVRERPCVRIAWMAVTLSPHPPRRGVLGRVTEELFKKCVLGRFFTTHQGGGLRSAALFFCSKTSIICVLLKTTSATLYFLEQIFENYCVFCVLQECFWYLFGGAAAEAVNLTYPNV